MTPKILGDRGENLVVELLKAQGWSIVATQWRCIWGELDIVASDRNWLVFIEVKTRSSGNWDLNGAMAITKSKQKKIYSSALQFLGSHQWLSTLSCRFDVALVLVNAYGDLTLNDCIESAFNGEEL